MQRSAVLPLQEQVVALRNIAAEKVRVQLDPIQQAQRDLLNGIAWRTD